MLLTVVMYTKKIVDHIFANFFEESRQENVKCEHQKVRRVHKLFFVQYVHKMYLEDVPRLIEKNSTPFSLLAVINII